MLGAAVDRMANCLRVMGSSESTPQSFQDVWLKVCRQSFAGMIKDKLSRTAEELKKEVDTCIHPGICRLFRGWMTSGKLKTV